MSRIQCLAALCALLLTLIAACDGDATLSSPDGSAADAETGSPADAETGFAIDAGATADAASTDSAPPGVDAAPLPIPATCNGSPLLCDRRYSDVVYATTHNAMSSETDGFFPPNQYFGISRQLDDGIRGLMLDVHDDNGEPALCHGICLLGSTPLVTGLTDIRRFLDDHRGEVVTIIFESYVAGDVIAGAFAEADLVRYVHTQPVGEPWPTLAAMIEADHRLVVLTDRPGGPAWNMDVWARAWETHFSVRTTGDFRCDRNRGSAGNPLFIFNHFLTNTVPVPRSAPTTNGNPLLADRAAECQRVSGALPNFVTVDFYSVGVVLEVVAALNQLD